MFDDELEDDALDEDIDVDDEEVDFDSVDDDDEEVDDDADVVEISSPRVGSKTVGISEDLPSLAAKQKERDELAKAMEEFLSRGGKVQEVADKIDV